MPRPYGHNRLIFNNVGTRQVVSVARTGDFFAPSMPQKPFSEPALVVSKAYDFTLWLLPKVEKFPRSFRFSLGDRLVSNGLDLLMLLVEAAYSKQKD